MPRTADILCTFGPMSTIWRLEALTEKAKEWIDENVAEPPEYMGDRYAFCADWRCGRDIAEAAVASGLVVGRAA